MRPAPLLYVVFMNALSCRSERARPESMEHAPFTQMKNTITNSGLNGTQSNTESAISLPPPKTSGGLTVATALAKRRSQRSFSPTPLSTAQLSQLAWAAQGTTEPVEGLRTSPSAGALYPLELYFVTEAGVLHYTSTAHAFNRTLPGDLREAISRVALEQPSLRLAPCTVVITAITARTARKYGNRAPRYVALEAGHAAQSLLLEATSQELVGVPIGAFDDDKLARLLALQPGEVPLYLIPVGHPQGTSP